MVWLGNLRPRIRVPCGGAGNRKNTGGGRAQARPGCSDPGSVCAAKCEACHIRPEGSALSIKRPGPLGIEDRTHDNAADGVLVVQVRRLRTIYRDISEFAAREALVKILQRS